MYLATLVLLIDSVKTKHNINEKNLNSMKIVSVITI